MKLGGILFAISLVFFSIVAGAAPYQEVFDGCVGVDQGALIKVHNNSVFYDVGKVGDVFVVKASVQLRYSHYFSKEEFEEAQEILESTRAWIEDYYLQYGIYLDIEFEHAPFDSTSRAAHPMPKSDRSAVVYIRRNTGYHMKSIYWGVNRDMEFNERAKLIAHEFSHLLGLKDEYVSTIGAGSQEEEASYEDDSLMKNADHPNPKLYPRHIKAIIGPYCQESGPTIRKAQLEHLEKTGA